MEPKETRWSLETDRCFHVLNRALKLDNYSPVPHLFTKKGVGFQNKGGLLSPESKKNNNNISFGLFQKQL